MWKKWEKKELKIRYYIKDIEENHYVDVHNVWYWEQYVLIKEITEIQNCIFFSKTEALEEIFEMTKEKYSWKYIIEEIYEI